MRAETPEQAPLTVRAPARPSAAGLDAGKRLPVRVRTYLVLLPLALVLILWIWLFQAEGAFRGGPNGKSFGADFAMFITAAGVMQAGGNPYDHQVLLRAEEHLLGQQRLPITTDRGVVRVGNPPLFFWALRPLTRLPYQPAALAWSAAVLLVSLLGFLALMAFFGWDRRVVPALIFLAFPQVVLGAFYGNVTAFVFAAVAFSLLLARRHPTAAGAVMTVGWLKPQIAFPAILLLALFYTSSRWRFLQGVIGGSIATLGATAVVAGQAQIEHWISGMLAYSRDIASSPDIASLSGLYVRVAPPHARSALELLTVLLACALTFLAWRRSYRSPGSTMLATAWLWVVWFLATPYAHFFDEILLAIPMLALLGCNGSQVTRRVPASALYLLVLSLLVIQLTVSGVQLLPLPLVGILVCLALAARRRAVLRPV